MDKGHSEWRDNSNIQKENGTPWPFQKIYISKSTSIRSAEIGDIETGSPSCSSWLRRKANFFLHCVDLINLPLYNGHCLIAQKSTSFEPHSYPKLFHRENVSTIVHYVSLDFSDTFWYFFVHKQNRKRQENISTPILPFETIWHDSTKLQSMMILKNGMEWKLILKLLWHK